MKRKNSKSRPTMSPEEIKRLRQALGLSQDEFAAHVGLQHGRGTIIRWEKGRFHPQAIFVERMRELARKA